MTEGARYVKIVEWSDEDRCFVGSCPGLFYGGCHGDDEKAVFAELCAGQSFTIRYSSYQIPWPDFAIPRANSGASM